MKSFKEYATGIGRTTLDFFSVHLKLSPFELFLKFDSKDVVTSASYLGPANAWMGSLCEMSIGKNLNQLLDLNFTAWDSAFKNDQTYWDLKTELSDEVFCKPLELLKSALDTYRGRDYLYQETSPLVCRCFGVREDDVLSFLKNAEEVTLEALGGATKAGMGCRSCIPQIQRWLSLRAESSQHHFYKEKSKAHWILEIDYMLSCFPEAADWKMEVESFKNTEVIIGFDKDVSQRVEEEVSLRLQEFLGASLDPDLSFFLRRSRQR